MAKLLIIDDEPDLRALYAAELEDEGHQVETAADIDEARVGLEHDPPDLVVLDIQIKRENGLQFLQEIVRRHPRLPVILCSAYSCYKEDFSSWLADGYVVKSSNLQELKDEVERQLRRLKTQTTEEQP